MSIDVGKGKNLLGEIVATAITSSKPVQKAAAGAADVVERLPMPSSSQVLAYHTGTRAKTQKAVKITKALSPAEIFAKKREELHRLNDLRPEVYRLNDYTLNYYARDYSPEEYERLRKCLFISGRGKHQLSKSELEEIIELSEEKFKMFSELAFIKGRKDKQFSYYTILDFLKEATSEQMERVKALSYIKGRGDNQLEYFYEIENLAEMSKEKFEQIKKLLFIPNRKEKQLNYDDIIKASDLNLNKHDFNNLLDLLSHNPQKSEPFRLVDIIPHLSDDKICKRLKELHYIKELGDKQLYFGYMENYAKLSDFKYKILKKLLYVDKFKDKQLCLDEIKKILKLSPQKMKKLISYLNDKDLNIDSYTFVELSKLKDTDAFISVLKQCPHREPGDISDLYRFGDKKVFESIVPFLKDPKYDISHEVGWIRIKDKQSNVCFSIYDEIQKNTDYFFEKPMPNGKKELTRIVKTSQGTFIDKGILENDDYFLALNGDWEKLHNFPENSTPQEILSFMERGDFKTSKIFEHSPEKHGHANFKLSKGANKYEKVNNSVISQLDTTKSNDAERITIHYPDGRVTTNDWDLDISTVLEPNKTDNGMRIRKFFGSDKIDLSSSVEDDVVTLTDNLTGKQLKFNISDIVKRDCSSSDDKYINFGERQAEITKLMKKLSPTTILNLLKLKKAKENLEFPFIKSWGEAFENSSTVTLSESTQITSHEMLHGISDLLDWLNDGELIKLHAKEAKNNKGLLSILSSYATNGSYCNAERGLSELISIMGTMNEYGVELSKRAEATRIAFPETTKAIEKKLMEHYKKTIRELFGN